MNDLKQFNNYFHGNILSLDYSKINKYLNSLSSLEARSIAHTITVLNSFYNFLLSENIVVKNPCDNLLLPRLPKKLPNYLTEDEVDKLLEC